MSHLIDIEQSTVLGMTSILRKGMLMYSPISSISYIYISLYKYTVIVYMCLKWSKTLNLISEKLLSSRYRVRQSEDQRKNIELASRLVCYRHTVVRLTTADIHLCMVYIFTYLECLIFMVNVW